MEPKKTRGRQRIVMKKMVNGRHRLVTFSKRRSGLYKKICEINVLCGAEVTAIVFSPAGNAFVFTTASSVEAAREKFLRPSYLRVNDVSHRDNATQNAKVNALSELFSILRQQEEADDDYHEQLKECGEKRRVVKAWWDADISKLSVPELQRMSLLIAGLLQDISRVLHKRSVRASSSPIGTPTTADFFK